jgi:hypothetical protein
MTSKYPCVGLTMPQPPNAPYEGFVACYRGGHPCNVTVETTETGTDTTTERRCRCCGDLKWMSCMPHEFAVGSGTDLPDIEEKQQ